MRPNEHNRFYLETKAARSGHYIDSFGKQHLPEQDEPVVIEADVWSERGPSSPRRQLDHRPDEPVEVHRVGGSGDGHAPLAGAQTTASP
jgi:hypothetical protein